MYGQSKAKSEFLSLINASVSHELRNPLNSIAAQNKLKIAIYQNLKEISQKNDPRDDHEALAELKIIKKMIGDLQGELINGLEVQEASLDIMNFMIMDLLDYSQIKSGKFRKVIKPFNIKEAVQKIILIQK